MAPRKRIPHANPEERWRPRSRAGKACGYTFDRKTCTKKGPHYCEPRADRVVAFFGELLVHTKGRWARRAFVLEPWQEYEIIRPLFGEVVWSSEWQCYVRRYRIAYIILGRKNGKSEIVAGIALYMLVGDDEEAAEVYGAARDTKQARKVWEPAERMRTLSEELRSRLGVNKNEKRIFDLATGSYYEIVPADSLGELGSNPHCSIIDEVLSQRDDGFYNAQRTAMGTRVQPLLVLISTETNDPSGFGAHQIDEAEKVQGSPATLPHVFAYVRKTPRNDEELERIRAQFPDSPTLPVSCDPWDERNWRHANPALGSFLSLTALREEAMEAKDDPTKENAFRQFRLNQRVSQVTRWLPLHLWDSSGGLIVPDKLKGRPCYGGLDLASTTDLAAWVLLFPDDVGGLEVLWRFWTPEAQLQRLDAYTGGSASVWQREGLLEVTEGDWIDYSAIHSRIEADKALYRLAKVGYDPKEATATAQWMMGIGLDVEPVPQGYALSSSLKELMRLVKAGLLHHGGHPVARWHADSAEVRRSDEDHIKLVKPDRAAAKTRIDGIAAAATAIKVWQEATQKEEPMALGAWR